MRVNLFSIIGAALLFGTYIGGGQLVTGANAASPTEALADRDA